MGTAGDVLVVDDDPLAREAVAAALDSAGIPRRLAADGAEALALVRAARPAVVLLDYYMPVLDGAAFCRALDADPGRDGTAVVLLTAAGESDAAYYRQLCAADALIRKPFGLDALLDTVRRLLAAA